MKTTLRGLANLTYNDADSIIIGGNQQQFAQFIRRYDGCGPIAAANIWLYLNFSYGLRLKIIEPPLNRAKIIALANNIYDQMPPLHLYRCSSSQQIVSFKLFGRRFTITPSLGVYSARRFRRDMKRLAQLFGQPIVEHVFRQHYFNADLTHWYRFIAGHLQAGRPIALLNRFHAVEMKFSQLFSDRTVNEQFKLHWVVVIGIEALDDDYLLSVMSWGGIAKISLKSLWQANRHKCFFRAQMIAYQVKQQAENQSN